MPAGVDKVNLDGRNKMNASFTLPFFKFGMDRKPLTFELSVTTANGTITDQVVITPRADLVTIGGAKWKARDFRVSGAGSIEGAVITVRSANGTAYGTAVVTGGAWELRPVTVFPRPIPEPCTRTPTSEAPQDQSPSPTGDPAHQHDLRNRATVRPVPRSTPVAPPATPLARVNQGVMNEATVTPTVASFRVTPSRGEIAAARRCRMWDN